MKKTFENDYEASLEVATAAKGALLTIGDTVEDEEISELLDEAYQIICELEEEIYAAEEEEEELGFIINIEELTRDIFADVLDAAAFAHRAARALIEITDANIYDTVFYELENALKAKTAC